MTPDDRPEVLLRAQPHDQGELPLVADGVARWVWESKFGPMLIEVQDGDIFVNGGRIERIPAGSKGNE